MSKVGDRIESCRFCRKCRSHGSHLFPDFHCSHPDRKAEIIIEYMDIIHPSCPLPDWPEVSRKELLDLLAFHGDETLGQAGDRAEGLMKSINVIIKEEKDGKQELKN